MSILKKILHWFKRNWKALVFATVYIYLLPIMLALTWLISRAVKIDSSIPSLLYLLIALLSLQSIAAAYILQFIFKDKAREVSRKVSLVLIPSGIFFAVSAVVGTFSQVGIPYDFNTDLGVLLSMIIVPMYFILLALLGGFILVAAFASFALLNFAVGHKRVIFLVFLISLVLWFLSILDIIS